MKITEEVINEFIESCEKRYGGKFEFVSVNKDGVLTLRKIDKIDSIKVQLIVE